MNDGAHVGLKAGTACRLILGADISENESNEPMSVDEMREWLLTAPSVLECNPKSYTDAARVAAAELLRWAVANPSTYNESAVETVYDWTNDPDHGTKGMKPEYVLKESAYQLMKRQGIPLGRLGLSGFQWGWAYNAVQRCLGLSSVSNPALIEITQTNDA